MIEQNQNFFTAGNTYSPEAAEQHIAHLTAQNIMFTQDNQRLKVLLNEYEQKMRELTAMCTQLKEQNESDRLQLADVMMLANKNAVALMENAKEDVETLLDSAKKEADRIKTTAISDSAELKKRLDAELYTMRDTVEKIASTIEATRQDLLQVFGQMDTSARKALALLNAWQQNAELSPPAPDDAPPANTNADYKAFMSDLLKDVAPPEKADLHRQIPQPHLLQQDDQAY